MRILLAVDGSVSSDRAVQLVSSFPLPAESIVRVVSVPGVRRLKRSLSLPRPQPPSPTASSGMSQAERRMHR